MTPFEDYAPNTLLRVAFCSEADFVEAVGRGSGIGGYGWT